MKIPAATAAKLSNEETPRALAPAVVTLAVPADDVVDDPELEVPEPEEPEDPELEDPDPETTGGCPVTTVVLLPEEEDPEDEEVPEEEEEEEEEVLLEDELLLVELEDEKATGMRNSVVTDLEASW